MSDHVITVIEICMDIQRVIKRNVQSIQGSHLILSFKTFTELNVRR